jgi:K+-transporting ATPase ATPase C chain
MQTLKTAFRALVIFTLVTGVAYSLFITAIAKLFFAYTANGSVVLRKDAVVGSVLLAQKNENARFFQPRPSASDYATVPSGASQSGPTQPALKVAVEKRRAQWGTDAPPDLLTASGSGLDPHISPAAAHYQIAFIARARNWNINEVARGHQLVDRHIEHPTFGFIGQPRVNVLMLNLDLETQTP